MILSFLKKYIPKIKSCLTKMMTFVFLSKYYSKTKISLSLLLCLVCLFTINSCGHKTCQFVCSPLATSLKFLQTLTNKI